MLPVEIPTEPMPRVSFDTRFHDLPGLRTVNCNVSKLSKLLIELGLPEEHLGDVEFFVTPAYRLTNPEDTKNNRSVLEERYADYCAAAHHYEDEAPEKQIFLVGYDSDHPYYGINGVVRYAAQHATDKFSEKGNLSSVEFWLRDGGIGAVALSGLIGSITHNAELALCGTAAGIMMLGACYFEYVRRETTEAEDRAIAAARNRKLKEQYNDIIEIDIQKRSRTNV